MNSVDRLRTNLAIVAINAEMDRIFNTDELQNWLVEQSAGIEATAAALDSTVDKLQSLRKAVGEDMWESIRNNPSIATLAEQHANELVMNGFNEVCERMAAKAKEIDASTSIDANSLALAIRGSLSK